MLRCSKCGMYYNIIWYSPFWGLISRLGSFEPKDTLCINCFNSICENLGLIVRWECNIMVDTIGLE